MEKNENKRSKRAAANINERRRMQSINNGFESLRELLNLTHKARLSKSAILQYSVDLLQSTLSENSQLKEQNNFLRNLISTNSYNTSYSSLIDTTPSKKQRRHSEAQVDINFNTSSNTPSISHKSRKTKAISFNNEKQLSPHKSHFFGIARSSVITKNLSYSAPLEWESPTHRSSRLLAKEQLLMTPPASGGSIKSQQEFLVLEKNYDRSDLNTHLTTPEFVKSIPPRHAKRSLDAIIQAIDQLEKV